MEIWDAYKADGSLAGFDLVRGEEARIPEGIYHLVCDIMVKHRDGSILIMQRDWNKVGYPGLFECSAGGSALKGESPLEGAMRELREETGIVCSALEEINVVVEPRNHSLYHTFVCVVDCDKASVTLQEGETISYRWLDREAFRAFYHSEDIVPSHKQRFGAYIEKHIL